MGVGEGAEVGGLRLGLGSWKVRGRGCISLILGVDEEYRFALVRVEFRAVHRY